MNEKKSIPGSTAAGEGVTTRSTETSTGGVASGNVPVAAPTDAAPGEPQAGNIGAPDASAEAAPKGAGFPLEVTVKAHTHGGRDYRKGQHIMLDAAEYRWALEHKVGKPGDAGKVGFEVNSKGEIISPETEKTLEELEAAASK